MAVQVSQLLKKLRLFSSRVLADVFCLVCLSTSLLAGRGSETVSLAHYPLNHYAMNEQIPGFNFSAHKDQEQLLII